LLEFQSRCKATSCVSCKVANTRLSLNKLEEEHFGFGGHFYSLFSESFGRIRPEPEENKEGTESENRNRCWYSRLARP
jgi:hypothetical protein